MFKGLDKNLVFLFFVLMVFVVAIFIEEKLFDDGQVFQVIAGIIASASTVFFQAARHTFGLPDDKTPADAKVIQTTQTTKTTISPDPDSTETKQ